MLETVHGVCFLSTSQRCAWRAIILQHIRHCEAVCAAEIACVTACQLAFWMARIITARMQAKTDTEMLSYRRLLLAVPTHTNLNFHAVSYSHPTMERLSLLHSLAYAYWKAQRDSTSGNPTLTECMCKACWSNSHSASQPLPNL